MLGSSIVLFIAETILAIVIPVTAPFAIESKNKTSLIVCLIASIICTLAAIIGVVGSTKRIKAKQSRGKSITALIFSIVNIVTGATLIILSIIFIGTTVVPTL